MGYAVTRPVGITDADFQEYVRLLRQRGIDIGRSPRVLEPQTGKRWLYVWNDREAARGFAEELNQQTTDGAWEVREVDDPPSDGPLGRIVIQMVRQSDGLTFAIDPLSRAMLRSAFPSAVGITTYTSLDPSTWTEFARTPGGVDELVRQILPSLTGLSSDQLDSVGYSLIDSDSDQTVLAVAPAAVAPAFILRAVGNETLSGSWFSA